MMPNPLFLKLARMVNVLLVIALVVPSAFTMGERMKTEEEVVGTRWARSIITIAKSYAAAERRNPVECDMVENDRKRDELSNICKATLPVAGVIDDVERLRDAWAWVGPEYPRSVEATCFRLLIEEGLESESPIARFLVLAAIFDMCDEPKFLTEVGADHCAREVEAAALRTLESDPDDLNRQLVLEMLAMGYATDDSKGMLLEIAKEPTEPDTRCVRVFSGDTSTDGNRGVDLDALARELHERRSPCESQLAKEALEAIVVQRK
jgi:LPS O-antigen subunit length determinant protein (WzzB/FepE family)